MQESHSSTTEVSLADKQLILSGFEKGRSDQIAWIKKLLKGGYSFSSRNIQKSIGYDTTLMHGTKTKIISHSDPILDEDLK